MLNQIETARQVHTLRSSRELNLFLFSTPQAASERMVEIINTSVGQGILIFDIDDTLFRAEELLRQRLNDYFSFFIPDFQPITLDSVVAAGGRYYQVDRYQEYAAELGLSFGEIYTQVLATNPQLHAGMQPIPGALDFQKNLYKQGYVCAGYATARPNQIAEVTALSLFHQQFLPAPVVYISADSGRPAGGKVDFFKNILRNVQTKFYGKIFFFDDDLETAIHIKQATEGTIVTMVPQVPRNFHIKNLAKTNGVIYGNFTELFANLEKSVPKLS